MPRKKKLKKVKIEYKTTMGEKREYTKEIKGNFETFSHRELIALGKSNGIEVVDKEKSDEEKMVYFSKSHLKKALAKCR